MTELTRPELLVILLEDLRKDFPEFTFLVYPKHQEEVIRK